MSIEDSQKWFEDFTGSEADEVQRVDFKVPDVVAIIGNLHSICYEATRDGQTELYEHTFKDKSAPLLCVSDDGRQLMIIGGNYEVTDRGIVDA